MFYADAVDRFIDKEAVKYQQNHAGKSLITDDKCDIEIIAGDTVDFPPLKPADGDHLNCPPAPAEVVDPDPEWPYDSTLEDDTDEDPDEEVEDEFEDEDEIFGDEVDGEEDLDEVEDEADEDDDIDLDNDEYNDDDYEDEEDD